MIRHLLYAHVAQAFWIPEPEVVEDTEDADNSALCLQPGVVYVGHDLADQPTQFASNAEECQRECNGNVECHAFTFTPNGCFLKNDEWYTGKRAKTERPGVVSWVKNCADCVEVGFHFDYRGAGVSQAAAAGAKSAAECWNACFNQADCAVFTFQDGCRLHSSDAEPGRKEIEGSELISWTKTCASNDLTDENVAKIMDAVVILSEEKSEKYADGIESTMEQCDRRIQDLSGEPLRAVEVDTRLERMAENAERLGDVLAPSYGDEELTEEEKFCKYDANGNRVTELEAIRLKIRGQRADEELGGGYGSSRLRRAQAETDDEVEPAFHEHFFRETEEVFDDKTAVAHQNAGCLEYGVNYTGGDLSPHSVEDAQTPSQCQAACDAEDDCFFFTFSDEDGCLLKGREAAPLRRYTRRTTDVSSSKQCSTCSEVGVRYPGHNLPGMPLSKVASAPECLRLCQNAPTCDLITFVDGVGCYLKMSEARAGRVFTGSFADISWRKDCGDTLQKCGDNEFVQDHKCVKCAKGTGNYAGDDPAGDDTECDKCTQIGVTFRGNDLPNQPCSAPTAAACRASCTANQDCHHFSFTGGKCFLKNEKAGEACDTNDEDDVSWSKACAAEPLSEDDFKRLILKEGDRFVKQMSERRLVKLAEQVEKKGKGNFNDLLRSDDDDDIKVVVESLEEAITERRQLQENRQWVRNRNGEWVRATRPARGQQQPQRTRVTTSRNTARKTKSRMFGLIKDQASEDEFVRLFSQVDGNDFAGIAGTAGLINSPVLKDLTNTISIIQPLIAAAATSNEEVRLRQLLESKLAVLKALPLPLPVQLLFSFAYQMVDKTNGHFANRSIDWKEMRRVIGPLTVTAVLEVVGNGHLKDLRAIYDMAAKVAKTRDLRAIQVNDVLSLGMAAMRTASLGSSFVFPVAVIPLEIGVLALKIVRDTGFLDNPRNNAILDDILGKIQGPRGSLVRRIIDVKHHIFKGIDDIIRGGIAFLTGGGKKRRGGSRRFNGGAGNIVERGGGLVHDVIQGVGRTADGIANHITNGIGHFLNGGRKRQPTNWRQNRRRPQQNR